MKETQNPEAPDALHCRINIFLTGIVLALSGPGLEMSLIPSLLCALVGAVTMVWAIFRETRVLGLPKAFSQKIDARIESGIAHCERIDQLSPLRRG